MRPPFRILNWLRMAKLKQGKIIIHNHIIINSIKISIYIVVVIIPPPLSDQVLKTRSMNKAMMCSNAHRRV